MLRRMWTVGPGFTGGAVKGGPLALQRLKWDESSIEEKVIMAGESKSVVGS